MDGVHEAYASVHCIRQAYKTHTENLGKRPINVVLLMVLDQISMMQREVSMEVDVWGFRQ